MSCLSLLGKFITLKIKPAGCYERRTGGVIWIIIRLFYFFKVLLLAMMYLGVACVFFNAF